MPKVLRIINRLNLGGPTYNASYLSKYLSSDYETLLVAGMKDESEASSEFIAKNLGLEPVYIEKMHRAINPFNDIPAYRAIRKIIREYKPDIVHTHAAKAGALGRIAAHREGVPVILHTFHGHVFHSYFNPLKTKVFLSLERYLASISTRIITISRQQQKEICEDFNICPVEKSVVIPLGFDLSRFQENIDEKRKDFRAHYALAEDEIAIGIVGRLVPVKNHAFFFRAVKKLLKQSNKKVRIIIIGDGELRAELQHLCTELELNYALKDFSENKSPVVFTGWIKNIDWAYAGLDIVALSSFNEGTPVSLIEAQAANKAIVSTAVGGIRDVVKEGTSALLSPSGDENQFVENLLKLVEDDALRMKMSKNSAAHALNKFNYKRLVSDTENLYNQLLNIKS
ncbi:MAG: glycosyltransferase [Chitinophagales bacterium]